VGTWTAGTWYRVRVEVDRSVGNGTASMWLDGALMVQDAQLGTAGIADIEGFAAVADHSSVPVYYDDVRIGVP
jgi:hypothetical protein